MELRTIESPEFMKQLIKLRSLQKKRKECSLSEEVNKKDILWQKESISSYKSFRQQGLNPITWRIF